jgi:hypothetical protein
MILRLTYEQWYNNLTHPQLMSSYLASQGRLTGLTKKFDGKTPGR